MRSLADIRIAPGTLLLALVVLGIVLMPWSFGGGNPLGRFTVTLMIGAATAVWLFLPVRVMPRPWWQNPDVLFAAFLALGLVSFFLSPVRFSALQELWLLAAAAVMFCVARAFGVPAAFRALATIMVTLGVVLALWSLALFFRFPSDTPRLFGTFKNADGLAAALLLPFTLGIGLWAQAQIRWQRLVFLTATAVLGVTFLLTSAAAAFLGLLAAGLIALVVLRRHIPWKLVSGLIGIVVLAIVVSVAVRALRTPQGQESFRATGLNLAGARTSFDQRMSFVRSSLAMAADHPLTGVGLGNWNDAFPQYQYSLRERTSLAHGLLPQYLGELGWPGLLVFLWLMGSVLVLLWKRSRDADASPLRVASAIGLTALALAGFMDVGWFFPFTLLSFWCIAGSALGDTAVPVLHTARRNALRSAVVLLGLFVLGWGLLRFVTTRLVTQAQNAARAQDAQDALGTADLALQLFPSPKEETTLLTMQYLAAGERERHTVRLQAERMVQHNPLEPTNYLILGRLERALGNAERAETVVREGLQKDPYWAPSLTVELGRLLLEQQRYDEARRVAVAQLDHTGADVPDRSITLSKVAEIAGAAVLNLGERKTAEDYLSLALTLDPDNGPARQLFNDAFGKEKE